MVAEEGALKIKELTYTHTTAVEAQELANSFGSFALRQRGLPVIVVVLEDEHKDYMLRVLQWLKESFDIKLLVISDL